MIASPERAPVAATSVTSLAELYSAALTLYDNTANTCAYLSKVMKDCKNDAAHAVFIDLADNERGQIKHISERAEQAGVRLNNDKKEGTGTQQLRGRLAREIADNPYLMTPYRCFRLAVINKERVFEILSALASTQNDELIRQQAEVLAQDALGEIARLRLQRLRASRSEIKTAVTTAGFNSPPITMDILARTLQTVDAILQALTLGLLEKWAADLDGEMKRALNELVIEFEATPNSLSNVQTDSALFTRLNQRDDSAFSALKTLLRELESAVDLLLNYAEQADAEEVTVSAQTKVENYIKHVAIVRDLLNKFSSK